MFRGINILDKIFNAIAFALVLLCFSLSINNSYAQTVQTDTVSSGVKCGQTTCTGKQKCYSYTDENKAKAFMCSDPTSKITTFFGLITITDFDDIKKRYPDLTELKDGTEEISTVVTCGASEDSTCDLSSSQCVKCIKSSHGFMTSENGDGATTTAYDFKCVAKDFDMKSENCYPAPNGGVSYGTYSTPSVDGSIESIDIDYDDASPDKKCLPRRYYEKIKNKCPFCSLFRVAFNVSSEMAYLSINTFSGTFVKVVIIGFAIWIALQVLTFVSTISMVNFKNFIQPLLTQGFIVAFAVIILQNGAMDFFNLALEPIYNTGMKIAQKTISIDDVAKAKNAEKNKHKIEDLIVACDLSDSKIITSETTPRGALPPSMGNNIICTMQLVYQRSAKIKALGSASICYSWEKKAFIIPHIGYLMTGLGLWVGAMLMILGVPFMMIDSVLQLAVAAALLPLAIAAYTFKITRKHTKSVWETFLNSMFSFIFVSLIALMLTLAFEQILIVSTHGSLDDLFAQEADKADMEKILEDIPWWGTSFIKVVFVTILAWAMLREALDFASDFSSTMSKTNLGSQIATMGGSAVKGMAVKATSSTVEAGWQVAKDAGGSAYRGLRNSGRRGLMALQGRNIRSNAANVQTNKLTGAKTYTDANGNKVTYGSDGTMESVTRVKQSTNRITGRTTTAYKTKTRDVSITSMDIKNRNGTVVGHREIIRHNSSRFSELQNANGTINNGTIDAILANTPPEAQDKVKVAIAKEIIGQRHKNLGMNMRKDDYTEQQVLTDEAGRFIGFSETHSDGSKTIVKLKTGENGRMLTELTSIDKKGRGQSLRTDGIINSRSRFNTENGTANGKIDEDSYKTIYSVAGRYRGANPKNPEFKKLLEEEGMFESEEIEAAFEAADSNDLNMHQFRN